MHVASLLAGMVLAAPGPGSPVPPVPEGHPRVYVRPADLPALRAKLEREELHGEWEQVRQSSRPLCQAFVYLATGNRDAGRAAIEAGLRALKESSDGRPFFNPMHFAACVYDWCYGLLTADEKGAFIGEFQRFAASHSPGYPPDANRVNPVVGHDCEGWILTNQLPAGVAVHDEAPEMYQAAARVFLDRFVEPRNFHYASHMHHQGTHYNGERFIHDQAASWLFRRMGAGDVLSREQQLVPYQLLYALRPDGKFLKSGDDNDDGGQSFNKRLAARLTGAYYNDPYLLAFSDRPQFQAPDYAAVFDLLFLDAGAPRSPLSGLPLAHWFGSPMGDLVARTGWAMGAESRDAVVQMRIGEHYFGNHHHRDFGTFQVYYRGPLAIDTGIYQGKEIENSDYGSPHWREYYTQTVAHNGLMLFDPATLKQDHGGQRSHRSDHPRSVPSLKTEGYRWAEVTAHASGPDPKTPEYSLLAGDITGAYLPSKAEKVTRAMVTLNTRSERYPCVLAIFDRVNATDAAFKKAWYLHCLQEPRVEGQTTTVVRDGPAYGGGEYGGQLVVETLLPAAARIGKVGGPGKECWNEATGRNYPSGKKGGRVELGGWRIEVIPARPAREDRFLHVLTVMDAGTPAPRVARIESGPLVGARVLDQVVLFNQTDALLSTAEFDVPGEGAARVLVGGLQPGAWRVAQPGGEELSLAADPDGKCLWFQAGPGRCRLRRVGE